MLFDADQFRRLFPRLPPAQVGLYHAELSRHLETRGMLTIPRVAAFVAQIGHESGDLRYWKEWDGGAGYAKYEGRASLGNTQSGDGARYCGRGPLQITGRRNYTAASQAAYEEGVVPASTAYVDHPELLEQPRHGFWTALWYWVSRDLIALSDRYAIQQISYVVNVGPWKPEWGGSMTGRQAVMARVNGYEDRITRYLWALSVLSGGV